MVHTAAARFAARAVLSRVASRAARRAIEVRTSDRQVEEVSVELGGEQVGFSPPAELDSPGDLPL